MLSPWFKNFERRKRKWLNAGAKNKVNDPTILAVSHEEALKILCAKPKQYHVVYITDPVDLPHDYRYPQIISKAAGVFVCLFRDIDVGETGKYPPSREAISKAIQWSENKNNVIVCCYSGISRAPAVAYVIATKKLFFADKALKVLDRDRHVPNLLVVQIGSEVLKLPDMFGFIQRFREEVFARKS